MQLSNQQSPLPTAWVAKIIQKMQVMYGTKFTQQWAGIDPAVLQAEWAEMLAGYTGDELGRGLDACRTRTFPPTLPEYMTLCRPPVQLESAFHEAIQGLTARRQGQRGEWSHPAIYHAACKVGTHDMLSGNYQSLRGRWEKALTDLLLDRNLDPVPEPLQALPPPTPTSKEEAQKVMSKLGAGNVTNKSGRDMKAWPHKIIANPGRYTQTTLSMARRALEPSA